MGIKELSVALKEEIGPYVQNPKQTEWPEDLGLILRLLPDGFFDDNFYLDPMQHKDIVEAALQIWPGLEKYL